MGTKYRAHLFYKKWNMAPWPSGKAKVCNTSIPSSILGGASKQKSTARAVLFCLERCVPQAERDAHFVRDVSFGNDVRFAREDAEHITSLCDETVAKQRRNTSLCVSTTSLRRSRNITLYKQPKVCYNKLRKAVKI